MSRFNKFKDAKLKPHYHEELKYPNYSQFIREIKLGKTNEFIEDYQEFIKEYPKLMRTLDKAIKLIYDDPIPPYVMINPGKRSVRECLSVYTNQLIKYLKPLKLPYKRKTSYVMSFAIYKDSTFSPSKTVNKHKDTGLRLVYEVMWNYDTNSFDIIFTNLNYHYYRNSAYSELQQTKLL